LTLAGVAPSRVQVCRRSERSTLAMGVFVASLLQGIQGAAAATGLKGHSFVGSPNVDVLAKDWFLGGTAIPSGRGVVLSPGVPNRIGMMWSRFPLITNDFEVTLKLSISGPETHTAKDEGFAFWYVQENVTDAVKDLVPGQVDNADAIVRNTWQIALAKEGLDLLAYRSKFNGVAVVFTKNPAVSDVASAVYNDGTKEVKLGAGIPSDHLVKYTRSQELVVKIRAEKTKVRLEIVGHGSTEFNAEIKAGGYIGFTCFGGEKGAVETTEKSEFVELLELEVTNHDMSAQGESVPEVSKETVATSAKDKEDVFREASSFKDHRAESDTIKDLTNLVFKLAFETEPFRQQVANAMESLSKRITAMEATFENLKQEIDKKTGHHLGKEFDAIKHELTHLSTVATKGTKERHKSIDSVHEAISDAHKTASSSDKIDHHLNKLAESSQRTMTSLTNGHQKMFGVSIVAIAFVIVAGLALYNKFRCWEKKHIL